MSLINTMRAIGHKARLSQQQIAMAEPETRNIALRASAEAISRSSQTILNANKLDINNSEQKQLTPALIDRLRLDEPRLAAIADALIAISDLPDPVNKVIASWQQPNGLLITRVTTPIGVLGIIFESRPNVIADAGGLAIKSGNAAILRCGSDSLNTCQALHDCMRTGLDMAGLDRDVVQLIPTDDRSAVGMMLTGLDNSIDIIIPRGGKSLVARVENEARVPVFAHLEGICHTYINTTASLAMAVEVTLNAKMRRTGICGATECVLIDKTIHHSHSRAIVDALLTSGCTIYGDKAIQALDTRVLAASEDNWGREYLNSSIAIRLVDDINAAIDHIGKYGSNHTDAIITEDKQAAEKFLAAVDSAIVMHNTSTQFADGGEFGMGAEIGIATGKLHARGPIGAEQLTSFKYKVYGQGQIRP